MIKLDTTGLPPYVVTCLMARGAQLPGLIWHEAPNRTAKRTLDEVGEDRLLLAQDPLPNEEMAAAVRALLYFWNGWPVESQMFAQLALERERLYIEALKMRQAGDPVRSKAILQQVGDHPIYPQLAAYAKEVINPQVATALKRLREIIQFAEQWEPYLFTDGYVQATSGKVDIASDQAVRGIQCREFELLFAHCYSAATGTKLGTVEAAPVARRRPVEQPRPRRPIDMSSAPKATAAKPPAEKAAAKPVSGVAVVCPKCATPLEFPASARGLAAQCPECEARFLVPVKSDAGEAAKAKKK